MAHFIVHPKDFVGTWKDKSDRSSNKEFLGWALAVAALVFGLYSVTSGKSVSDSLLSNLGLTRPAASATQATPKPKILAVRFDLGGGIGIFCPELLKKGWDGPQTVLFRLGAGTMFVSGVIPSKIGTKAAELLLTNLYAYFVALSLFPAFRLLKADVSFENVASLAVLLMASAWTLSSLWVTFFVICFVDIARLRGLPIILSYVALVVIPLAALLIRAAWSGFRALSQMRKARFLGALLIAWVISWVVFPVVAPLIYLTLRFQSLLDTVL